MRDNSFLAERLDQIWKFLFPELERKNNVVIRFKGNWKNKFGHIKLLRNKDTEIVINGFFKNEAIPDYIIDLTIAHELIHYMHGFNSPYEKRFRYPHQGNIVDKELVKRGFGEMLRKEKEFIKEEWPIIVKENFKPRKYSFRFF
ncbi:MAG: hypothetical protein PHG05_02085 [Candidatus Nanoarchaeia archaeon]|nr:hypothetical protein [Candidatus Nanoarchaeia archaeon]